MGWYGAGPLALKNALSFSGISGMDFRAKGPSHTSLGQRPRSLADMLFEG